MMFKLFTTVFFVFYIIFNGTIAWSQGNIALGQVYESDLPIGLLPEVLDRSQRLYGDIPGLISGDMFDKNTRGAMRLYGRMVFSEGLAASFSSKEIKDRIKLWGLINLTPDVFSYRSYTGIDDGPASKDWHIDSGFLSAVTLFSGAPTTFASSLDGQSISLDDLLGEQAGYNTFVGELAGLTLTTYEARTAVFAGESAMLAGMVPVLHRSPLYVGGVSRRQLIQFSSELSGEMLASLYMLRLVDMVERNDEIRINAADRFLSYRALGPTMDALTQNVRDIMCRNSTVQSSYQRALRMVNVRASGIFQRSLQHGAEETSPTALNACINIINGVNLGPTSSPTGSEL